MDEKVLVGKLFASLPVLRHSLPPDVSRLVGFLRKAFVSRGLSRSSRSRILTAIEELSKFEVGLITTEELASCREPQDAHEPVSTVAEVIHLACQLYTLSERASKAAASPTAQSPAPSSPQVLRTPSTPPRPATPEGTPFLALNRTPPPEEADRLIPVPRTPPPLAEHVQPLAPHTPDESSCSSSGEEVVTPDSAFSSCSSSSDSQIEVLKTTLETDASFRPATPPPSETASGYPEPSERGSPVPTDSTCCGTVEVPSMPSQILRPVTPPCNDGSEDCEELVPVTPPPSPEKRLPLACTPKRKDGPEMVAFPPTTPDSSPSSSVSSDCRGVASTDTDIMISMHVPECQYGQLLGIGGNNIKQIEALTGAKLVLLREYGALEIRGVKNQCLEARMLAGQVVNKVNHVSGNLCYLPHNFFNSRSIWTASRLESIAKQNSCILKPLMGVYDRGHFVFIHGTLQSDVECCRHAIKKLVMEFLQARSLLAETCTVARTTPQERRVQYSRSQLMSLSFCGGAESALRFFPGTEELGILSRPCLQASIPGPRSSTFGSPNAEKWNEKKWNEKKCASQESKWEHDLFEG